MQTALPWPALELILEFIIGVGKQKLVTYGEHYGFGQMQRQQALSIEGSAPKALSLSSTQELS